MCSKVCPVCKSKIYGVNCKNNKMSHRGCRRQQKLEKAEMERPHRTSTPISEPENNAGLGFSDSVSDFFYQSWKSGLHSDESMRSNINFNTGLNQQNLVPQTVCFTPQIIYVNAIICQPYVPSHAPVVGYRPDGTYGVLQQQFWPFN